MVEDVPPVVCNGSAQTVEGVEGAAEAGDGSLALISEALEQVMQERKSDEKGGHKEEKAVDERGRGERKKEGDQSKEEKEEVEASEEEERDEAGSACAGGENVRVGIQDSGNEEDDENEQEDEEEEEGGGQEDKKIRATKGHANASSQDLASASSFPNSPADAPAGTDSARSSPTPSTVKEFVEVDLSDIRKDVQCPICLGIIRKTRTVMECLHRFCRECIDKSMRLGNNECPVCRTHCASRRSLRDDLNFDALIAALYPNVDIYEEEEFALREENERRNKQLQESIAETLERQSDATRRCTVKATATLLVRKAPNKVRNVENQNKGKTQSYGGDDEAYEEYEQPVNIPETTTRERRSRRRKRDTATFQVEMATEDEQVDVPASNKSARLHSVKNEETKGEASASNVGRWEGLATWARAGSRSAPRYANMNNSNNRLMTRATLLLEALSAATQLEREIEFDVHLTLQPFNHDDYYDKLPSLDKPYLCCPANVTVQHVCEFLANRLPIDPDEELELVLGNNDGQDQPNAHLKQKVGHDGGEGFRVPEILHPQATLGQIHEILWHCHGNLVLMYRRRM